nr:MAG TPA: hypothetical protein [Caudoviricetes sp.]DAZ07088.1 MAG TPA: hypothetical protein [Caudoviricetes sp.]
MTKSRRVDDDSTVGIFVIIWVEGGHLLNIF